MRDVGVGHVWARGSRIYSTKQRKLSILVSCVHSQCVKAGSQACSMRWKTGPHHNISSLAIHRIVLRKSLLLMNVCFPSMTVGWYREK